MTVYTAAVTSQKSGSGSGLSVFISATGDDAPHVTISLKRETRQVPVWQLRWWASWPPLGRSYPLLWWSSSLFWSNLAWSRTGELPAPFQLITKWLSPPAGLNEECSAKKWPQLGAITTNSPSGWGTGKPVSSSTVIGHFLLRDDTRIPV